MERHRELAIGAAAVVAANLLHSTDHLRQGSAI